MTTSTAVVLGLMVVAVVLFVSDRLRSDMVAMIILGALLLTGIITPEEGFSGFGHPATVAVAAMFVLSAGLETNRRRRRCRRVARQARTAGVHEAPWSP